MHVSNFTLVYLQDMPVVSFWSLQQLCQGASANSVTVFVCAQLILCTAYFHLCLLSALYDKPFTQTPCSTGLCNGLCARMHVCCAVLGGLYNDPMPHDRTQR